MSRRKVKGKSNTMDDLIKRIVFTVVSLLVYRFGSFVPVPFIDVSKLSSISDYTSKGVFGMFNLLSGGSLERMSVFAIGVVPYITASIIIQLLFSSVESLKKVKNEGEAGQVKMNQYIRYLCLLIAFFQGYTVASGLGARELFLGLSLEGTAVQKLAVALTFTTGTFYLLWVGERITASGIGNGISMIIFAGIVVQFPSVMISLFKLMRTGGMSFFVFFLIIALFVISITVIVVMEKSYRVVKMQHPSSSFAYRKPGVPAKAQAAPIGELPLKINPSGVIPPIFASSILLLPVTFLSFLSSSQEGVNPIMQAIVFNLSHGKPLFIALYSILIIFFTFFYSDIIFNPHEISEQFRKASYFVSGIRPGASTANFLRSLNNRLCFIGGIYLSVICIIPELASSVYSQAYVLGGTSMLIVVNVITDTISQVNSYIISFRYGKMFKGTNVK